MTDEIPIISKEEMETRKEIRKRRKEIERRKEDKIIGKVIQGYKFTERAIKNMKKLNEKTKITGLEYGSKLCGDPKTHKIDSHYECTGTELT